MRNIKKALAVFLSVLMVCTMLPLSAMASDYYDGLDGSNMIDLGESDSNYTNTEYRSDTNPFQVGGSIRTGLADTMDDWDPDDTYYTTWYTKYTDQSAAQNADSYLAAYVAQCTTGQGYDDSAYEALNALVDYDAIATDGRAWIEYAYDVYLVQYAANNGASTLGFHYSSSLVDEDTVRVIANGSKLSGRVAQSTSNLEVLDQDCYWDVDVYAVYDDGTTSTRGGSMVWGPSGIWSAYSEVTDYIDEYYDEDDLSWFDTLLEWEGLYVPYSDDTVLEAGTLVAIAFNLNNITESTQWSFQGYYDMNLILPVTATHKKGVVTTSEAYVTCVDVGDNLFNAAGDGIMETCADEDTFPEASAFCETGQFAINNTHSSEFWGYTVLYSDAGIPSNAAQYIGDEDMTDFVFEGKIYVCVSLFEIQTDCTVADLSYAFTQEEVMAQHQGPYNCNFGDDNSKDWIATWYTENLYTLSSEDTETTYTYTFADGTVYETTDADDVPSNTDTTIVANNDGTHTTTTYEWTTEDDVNFTEVATETTEDCAYTDTTVNATCTEDGYTTYVCDTCGYSYTEEIPATGHTAGDVVIENTVDATCTTDGSYDEVYYCTVDGVEISRTTVKVDATGHTYEEVASTDATCTEAGTATYTCSVCGDTYTVETDAALGHDYVGTTTDPTCTEDGYTTYTCSVCGDTYTDNVVSATGHSYVATTVDATCTEDGYTTYTCSVCGDSYTETISATGHTAGDAVTENEVEATCGTAGSYDTVVYCTVCGEELSRETTTVAATGEHSYVKSDDGAGTITYTCSVCGDTYTETYEVADTVTITTIAAEGTTISINGVEVDTATTAVEAGSTYTITTTGAAGIIVETTYIDATSYTAVATGDATYTTVADETAEDITITFVDEFGNLVATWTAEEAAAATALPDAIEFTGVDFAGWDATLEEVQAATTSMVVTATYTASAGEFTVTAEGATITVYNTDDTTTDYSDSATVAYYSTKVTVAADDATVWYVDGAAVAYGSSYTFYVGSDITLTYDTDAVTAATTVTSISATGTDTYKVNFLASRSVADGDTLVESGWVYGKAMSEDDLVLENVGTTQGDAGATVKKNVNSNTSSDGQFMASYGVTAMNATACARPYVTYTTSDGESVTIYGAALIYEY